LVGEGLILAAVTTMKQQQQQKEHEQQGSRMACQEFGHGQSANKTHVNEQYVCSNSSSMVKVHYPTIP
jgi:hypothetical protein